MQGLTVNPTSRSLAAKIFRFGNSFLMEIEKAAGGLAGGLFQAE
jgi:hypothetical protein